MTSKEVCDFHKGWFQCSQCGNGFWVRKWEFQVGDRKDREPCPCCLFGFMSVEWEKSGQAAPVWERGISTDTEGLDELISSLTLLDPEGKTQELLFSEDSSDE